MFDNCQFALTAARRACVSPGGREEPESEIGGRAVGLSRWERRTRSAREGQPDLVTFPRQPTDNAQALALDVATMIFCIDACSGAFIIRPCCF
jgi:hypothetical protein